MREFKVGDKVICLLWGKGVVIEVKKGGLYPIIVDFGDNVSSFMKSGKNFSTHTQKVLYHIEENPRVITGNDLKKSNSLSNVMQAVQWLEQGEKIQHKSWEKDKYLSLDRRKVVKDEKDFRYDLFSVHLFDGGWHLYIEPKYTECDFLTAVKAFQDGKKVMLGMLMLQEEEQGIGNILTFTLTEETKNLKYSISSKDVLRTDWRIYE